MSDVLMTVPIEAGAELIVEVDRRNVPDDLVLAGADPYQITARAAESLEILLAKVTPTVEAVGQWARSAAPDECSVEFGLKIGGEAGIMVAKGTAEVNFVVTLLWRTAPSADGADAA